MTLVVWSDVKKVDTVEQLIFQCQHRHVGGAL